MSDAQTWLKLARFVLPACGRFILTADDSDWTKAAQQSLIAEGQIEVLQDEQDDAGILHTWARLKPSRFDPQAAFR